MRTEGYEYQSELARRNQAKGRAEGILTVLEARDLEVTEEQRKRIVGSADLDELEQWLRRAATVSRTEELFG